MLTGVGLLCCVCRLKLRPSLEAAKGLRDLRMKKSVLGYAVNEHCYSPPRFAVTHGCHCGGRAVYDRLFVRERAITMRPSWSITGR